MAISPGSNNELSIQINGDASGLTNSVNNAKSSLGGLSKAVAGAGAGLAALGGAGIAKSVGAFASFEIGRAHV